MKNYYEHLSSTQVIGAPVQAKRKPVYRSSAIFPVIHNSHFTSRISFMGYWLLKRNIHEIGLLYTLRDQQGNILTRNNFVIDKAQTFNIDVYPLLQGTEGFSEDKEFQGSIELEIFSTRDLVYPYPAFVVTYYNEYFSTAVHTTGRVYNDLEDWNSNEELKVAEAGFDIHASANLHPFISFTNGPVANEAPVIDYTVINHRSEELKGSIHLMTLKPFETLFLRLDDHIEVAGFLEGKAGTIKLHHNFKGFFPRFIAGNFQDSIPSVSITHTYYDCSIADREQDYWDKKDTNFNDSSILVPLFITDDHYTDVILYPIFSPSVFQLSLEFYDKDGNMLGSVYDYMTVQSINKQLQKINLRKSALEAKIDLQMAASANIIANWNTGSRIPTRLKMGLNVGTTGRASELPCNICFAPQLGNPSIAQKQGTFKWLPMLNIGNSVAVFNNSSPMKNYNKPANVVLKFFRENDSNSIERTVQIPAFGCYTIDMRNEPGLQEFFDNKSGWITAQSDNPYLNGWYFDFNESGAVAGDHSF